MRYLVLSLALLAGCESGEVDYVPDRVEKPAHVQQQGTSK